MTDQRDPRTDPRPGDVLRDVFSDETKVVHVWDDAIVTRLKDGVRTNVNLAYWRQWYHDATIIKRATQ